MNKETQALSAARPGQRVINRDIASALIFSEDSKLLLGKKDPKSGGVYLDCWHIPGGGADEGESITEALYREVVEEVGLDISLYDVALIDDTGTGETQKTLKESNELVLCKMKFYVYKVVIDRPADKIFVRPGDDLAQLAWVNLPELITYKLTPPSIKLFTRLGLLQA